MSDAAIVSLTVAGLAVCVVGVMAWQKKLKRMSLRVGKVGVQAEGFETKGKATIEDVVAGKNVGAYNASGGDASVRNASAGGNVEADVRYAGNRRPN